ncbi:restriction endonuclease subunit S [Anoxybacillus ayderensis]|uniref:restriction endonuclease subunit S n=1 Tax=Anoxybacillus ayderensis TaxID=265546 RepID=UPI002E1EF1C0|nr:restriction endonuclease subunit S [Anoxybacillus ayderensis]MED0686125.1 restriction endonuclease subunit S [Anoxybacillus ayderensis]
MKYKIEELCEINSENISKSDDIKYIYYLDTSNLTRGTINELQKLIVGKDKLPSRAKRKVKVNDILISTVRPNQRHYGIIRKEIENLIVSTGFAVLSPNLKKVNPEYLYWYLTQDSIVNYLQSIAETSTSAYPSIKPSVIGGLEIDLPKLEEQKAIANILSTLDEKIETNNQINEKLEEMAQALFKHWFVDFEFPNENGKPYKSSGGEMVESELGMIPKGWKIKRVGEIVNITRGASPRPIKDYIDAIGMPWVKISDATESKSKYINETKEFIKEEGIPKSKKVSPGTLILSNSATPGIPKIMLIEACVHDGWLVFQDYQYITKEFLYYFLMNEREKILTLSNGSVFRNLKTDILKNYKIVVPTLELIEKANKIFQDFNNEIERRTKEIKILSNIRDTLLPKLMSGEIRVPLDDEVLSEKN